MDQHLIQHGEYGWINTYPTEAEMNAALRRLNDEEGARRAMYPWYRMWD